MGKSTGVLVAGATLFLTLGAACAFIVSGEWMIPACGIGGWLIGIMLIRSLG